MNGAGSLVGNPVFELSGKPSKGGFPITVRHCPLLADVVQHHKAQHQQGLIAEERAPALGHLAQTHVHRLDGVGRVNDPPHLRRFALVTRASWFLAHSPC